MVVDFSESYVSLQERTWMFTKIKTSSNSFRSEWTQKAGNHSIGNTVLQEGVVFVDVRYDSLVAKTEKSLLHMHHPCVEILDKFPIIQSKQYTMENWHGIQNGGLVQIMFLFGWLNFRDVSQSPTIVQRPKSWYFDLNLDLGMWTRFSTARKLCYPGSPTSSFYGLVCEPPFFK